MTKEELAELSIEDLLKLKIAESVYLLERTLKNTHGFFSDWAMSSMTIEEVDRELDRRVLETQIN